MTAAENVPQHLANWTHGRATTYLQGCRCHRCKVAMSEYGFNLRRQRAEALALDPTLKPHGSRSTYTQWGCRCEACVKANTDYCRARRAMS